MKPNTPTAVTDTLPWYGRVWQIITKSAQWSMKKIRPALPIMAKGLETFGRICAAFGIIFLDVITEKKSYEDKEFFWEKPDESDPVYQEWIVHMSKKK